MSVAHKPEPPDGRPIADLRFGLTETERQVEAEAGTGIMVPEVIIDEKLASDVRDVFTICGAVIAQDIVNLGCTGLAAHNISIEVAQRVRLGLAGSGVGLPCYVGPDRFCLIHNVIGGLQEAQEQRHTDYVNLISRDLTPAEKAHVAVMETARRAPQRDARDALSGHRMPEPFLKEITQVLGGPEAAADALAAEAPPPAPVMPKPDVTPPTSFPLPPAVLDALRASAAVHFECVACGAVYPWPIPGLPADLQPKERRCTRCFAKADDAEVRFKCPDHDETEWHCRFCVASAMVKGELSPVYLFTSNPTKAFTGDEVAKEIAERSASDIEDGFTLYVRIARWKRQITRI